MMSKKPVLHDVNLFNRVVEILEQARTNVVRTVNSQMVISYWFIGREIVEEEQRGEARAGGYWGRSQHLNFRLLLGGLALCC